jgi:hypothetical protein
LLPLGTFKAVTENLVLDDEQRCHLSPLETYVLAMRDSL